jgi:hypothetical protein
MENNKVILEYSFDNNIVKIVKENYFTKTGRYKIDYCFVFTNSNTLNTTTLTRHKTVGGALKKFNKAVKAINEGTKIK